MSQWTPDRLRQLRARLGLTQQGLAERLHVALPTVNRWERGKFSPSWHIVQVLNDLEEKAGDALS